MRTRTTAVGYTLPNIIIDISTDTCSIQRIATVSKHQEHPGFGRVGKTEIMNTIDIITSESNINRAINKMCKVFEHDKKKYLPCELKIEKINKQYKITAYESD